MKGFSLLFLLLISFCGFSQEVQQDSITQLDEIILLEDVVPKRAVGITASSTLGPTTFEKFNPIDIASAINQVSGVYILSGALNTNRITIRGVGARTPFGTNKLRLYFNGIPVTDGAGTSTIEAFDFENLGSMEVIKGPKATAYGANLGGAIMLDTKLPFEEETRLTNSFTIGSFGMVKDNLSFQHSDDKLELGFSYNHFKTDGYRQNNNFERDGFLLTSKIRLGEKNSLGLLVNHIDYNAQIPSSINQTDFDEDPTRAAGNWLAAQGFEANKYTLMGLSYSQEFTENLKNTTSIFYTYLDHYEPRPFNILDEFTNGFGLRTQFEGGNFLGGNYVLGAELYKDEYHWGTFQNLFGDNNGNGSLQGDRLSRNLEFRTQLNVFTSYTYPLTDKLHAQVGFGLNSTSFDYRDLFNTGDANASAERDFDTILLPNLGLQYQLATGSLYANVSRGFSNPSLEQTLTPDGLINPEIEQEKGVNLELGAALTLFQKSLSLDFALYRMTINDLFVEERVGEDQFIGRNAGETRHQGLELDIKYALKLCEAVVLSPYLSYTLNDHGFVDFVDEDNDFSGNPLTGVPKHRISSGLDIRHSNGLRFNLTHQFVDEIPLRDDNSLNSESFNVFHAKLAYQTSLSDRFSLGLNAGINNLFDTNYAQSVLINASSFGGAAPRYFYPGNGRNIYGGVTLGYSL